MGSRKKALKREQRLFRDLREARTEADERLLEATAAWEVLDARSRDAHERVIGLQQQLDDVLSALAESSVRLHAAVSAIDDLPTGASTTDVALDLRRRLEQMLLTQQRTNELLDLALGVAMEPDDADRRIR